MRILDSRLQMYFSREAELKRFQLLAERGLAPDLLATFEDGRVEEFLPGKVSTVCTCDHVQ